MATANYTPFLYKEFEKIGQVGELFDVIVVVGTFDLVHGGPMEISEEQKSILVADRYDEDFGFGVGVLIEESHLVMAKHSTDFILTGKARPKNGIPSPTWIVSVRVGPMFKRARVTGPREWLWRLLPGWRVSEPEPTSGVDLHMGMAYGGAVKRENYKGPPTNDIYNSDAFEIFPDNPVGMGFLTKLWLDRSMTFAAAQIEDINQPIYDIHKRYKPVAFGPVARNNPDRARFIGTCDAKWQKEIFPFFPDDFDYAFYQCAQPDLIASQFLQGNERIILEGCHPQGRFETQLPGIRILAILTDTNGHVQSEPMRLDTVTINLDDNTGQVVWRLTIPKAWELRDAMLAAIPDGPPPTGAQRPITINRPFNRQTLK